MQFWHHAVPEKQHFQHPFVIKEKLWKDPHIEGAGLQPKKNTQLQVPLHWPMQSRQIKDAFPCVISCKALLDVCVAGRSFVSMVQLLRMSWSRRLQVRASSCCCLLKHRCRSSRCDSRRSFPANVQCSRAARVAQKQTCALLHTLGTQRCACHLPNAILLSNPL